MFSYGVVKVSQGAIGLFTIAQFGFGICCLGQFAPAILISGGQFALGFLAIGQMALRWYSIYVSAGHGYYQWQINQLNEIVPIVENIINNFVPYFE